MNPAAAGSPAVMSEGVTGQNGLIAMPNRAPRPRLLRRSLSRLLGACLLLPSMVSLGTRPEINRLAIVETGFEEGLKGWWKDGAAEFAIDTTEKHSGKSSFRLTVPQGTKLSYQKLSLDHTTDIGPGDIFNLDTWVRSNGLTADPGAYCVVEFLAKDGRRTGIVHSLTGRANGSTRWDQLRIRGATAPKGTGAVRVSLILHAHGTAWFDDVKVERTSKGQRLPELGDVVRKATVHVDDVVHPCFGGVGYHVFYHLHETTSRHLNTTLLKHWRELNPAFVRATHNWEWDDQKREYVAEQMAFWKTTGTEIYLTTWNPEDATTPAERLTYAKRVVDMLEYFVREKHLTNIKTYCMTNEMSLKGWGKLRSDLPKFRDYHRKIHAELRARNLPIQLLATDAAPVQSWHTIEWATQNMNEVTGVYGGHHYFNKHGPDDEQFYRWFLDRLSWGTQLARDKGKDFILGEFGSKQDGRTVNGVKLDKCVYWDTPREPQVAIQLVDAVVAALNAGVYALAYWTFTDFPDDYRKTYINKWGTFKWSGTDFATRDVYYGFGLLSKFLRGPAIVYRVSGNDPRVRVAALRHHGANTWSFAAVNRNARPVDLSLELGGIAPTSVALRKYVYDPTSVPQHPFGDLQPPAGTVAMVNSQLEDTLGPSTITVYTSACDGTPPAPVEGLCVSRPPDGDVVLSWRPSPAPDLCYYRIYRTPVANTAPSLNARIGSTVATQFRDINAPVDQPTHYTIVAVDQSGNPREAR
jgi:hypothetical protein